MDWGDLETQSPVDCEWARCNRPASVVLWDELSEISLCGLHCQEVDRLMQIQRGLRFGVLGGIFAGFLT